MNAKKILSVLLMAIMLVAVFVISVSAVSYEAATTDEIATATMVPPVATMAPVATEEKEPTQEDTWSSRYDIRDTWSGKTLNVACSTWYSTGAPWAMPEVFITEENDANFGTAIQEAVLERNKYIEDTYGVKVNWLDTTSASMQSVLEAAAAAKNVYYDLAAPRMMNVQDIVAGGYVYDLQGRAFIDFDNSYYNDLSVKAFTAQGHTFFVTGGFSTLDKETASVLYFNKNLLASAGSSEEELYDMVRSGKWTFDELVKLAESVYCDDGDGVKDDGDTFGLSIYASDKYYQYFGVPRAASDASTGNWYLSLDDENVDDIIANIIKVNTASWANSTWDSNLGAFEALENGTLLFYNEVLQRSYVAEVGDIGVVPFPMLNAEQGRYYVPCSNQMSVAMCIPKVTQDRKMSDYFLDVLAWTGDEYLTETFIDSRRDEFDGEEEIEMLTDYILPNICYDPGEAVGWGTLISLSGTYANNQNTFEQYYQENAPRTLETIKTWNEAWGSYPAEEPEIPVDPVLPDNPDAPVVPDVPTDPEDPKDPVTPDVPEEPENPVDTWSSKYDIRDLFAGKELNVACSKWYANNAPWAMPEAFVTEDNDARFGVNIQEAVLERNDYIEETYGVKVNWLDTTSASMHNVLESAYLAKNINYDLALPRGMNAQDIVAGGLAYDLAGRKYIDFNNSYYNDLSVETYTSNGHTFFVAGGFSTLDKQTAYMLYFNKDLLNSVASEEELYDMVRNGTWTYDQLLSYAMAAYNDSDGNGSLSEGDTYGISTNIFDKFFNHFGITRAAIDENGKWMIGVSDSEKMNTIVDMIVRAGRSSWYRSSWSNDEWSVEDYDAVQNGTLLFLHQVANNNILCENGSVGIIPFPKFDEAQVRYYAPCSNQMSVLMCVPKTTQDREMSDYMLDVLAWTGDEYTTKAYLQNIADTGCSDTDMEMLTEYIYPNISYDAGESVGWGSLINVSEYYANNTNNYSSVYNQNEAAVNETIAKWNAAWGEYPEEEPEDPIVLDVPTVEIITPSDIVALDKEIKFTLVVSKADLIKSIGAEFIFDDSVFEFVSAKWITPDAPTMSDVNSETYRAVAAWNKLIDANTEILEVTLKAKALADVTTVDFAIKLQDDAKTVKAYVEPKTLAVVACDHSSVTITSVDGEYHLIKCDLCDYEKMESHKCSKEWHSDADGHWNVCEICGGEANHTEHIYKGSNCRVCGYTKYILGDVDNDKDVDSDDSIYLLYNIFFGDEEYPINQPCDFDGSGSMDSDDSIYLLYNIFFGNEEYPLHR